MSGRLSGKVCIVTGTAGSMGRATALTFGREGALLVGCDVGNATRGEIEDERWAREMLDRTLFGRFGKPEEVANVALFLASERAHM